MENEILSKKKIIIFWEGFPSCGLLVREVLIKYPRSTLFFTKPQVPFDNVTDYISGNMQWLKRESEILEHKADIEDADLFLFTGWTNAACLSLAKKIKSKRKTVKIAMAVDNNYRKTLRQLTGKLFFFKRIWKDVDYFFVPGRAAYRLGRFFGVPSEKIFMGYYGAFSGIYKFRKNRKKGFVFVGQKIKRKGIDVLTEAYRQYSQKGGKQPLKLIGGESRGQICDLKEGGLSETGFLQPDEIAKVLNQSLALILPSKLEHWGTVCCEAAACGCLLICSDKVGSIDDLLINGVNGFEFTSNSSASLCNILLKLDGLDSAWFNHASSVSRNLAEARSERSYLNALESMMG